MSDCSDTNVPADARLMQEFARCSSRAARKIGSTVADHLRTQ